MKMGKAKGIFLGAVLCSLSMFGEGENAPSNLIDLELNQVPIAEAFVLLGEASGKNILVQEELKKNQEKRISVSIHQQDFESVLSQLLKESGLVQRQAGEAIEVRDPNVWSSETQTGKGERVDEVKNAPLLVDVFPIKFGNTQEIFEVIKQSGWLSSQAKLTIDHSLNTLLAQGTAEDMSQIHSMLKALDVPPVQVLIEARIVEVDEQALQAFGVNISNVGIAQINGQTSLPVSSPAGTLNLSLGELPAGISLDLAIQALETRGNGQVVSAPNLLVSDGQMASIEQGAEVPYATESENGTSQVQFKKAVMGLTVTPRVINNEEVSLDLVVNKDAVSTVNLASAKNEPLISTQEIKTQVRVADKKTIVLGGIIESDQDDKRRQVPVLGSIPLIGGLFTSREHLEKRKQIIIFVTPTIVRPNPLNEGSKS